MPYVPVDGIDLYYETHGQGSPIVFAHGVGGNHLIWWQQVPFFSRHFKCITFDHRAFGLSADRPNGPGPKAFVEDLRSLLDHLGIEKTFLVAQSMGGLACLGFALAYPERCLGLVLGSSTGAIGEDNVAGALKRHKSPGDTRDRFAAASFVDNQPELTHLFLEISALNPPRPTNFTAIFRSGEGPKARDLKRLLAPTLIIGGEHDVVVPNEVLDKCHQLISGSRLVIIPGAGHSTYYEKPHKFNRLVADFFDSILEKE